MLKVDFPSRNIGHFFSIFLLFSDLSEKEIEISLDLDLSEFEDFDDVEDCDIHFQYDRANPLNRQIRLLQRMKMCQVNEEHRLVYEVGQLIYEVYVVVVVAVVAVVSAECLRVAEVVDVTK